MYNTIKTITDKIPSGTSSSNKLVANSEDIKWAIYQETTANVAVNTKFSITVEYTKRKVVAIGAIMIAPDSSFFTQAICLGPNVVNNGIKLTFFTKADYGSAGVTQKYTLRCYYGYKPIQYGRFNWP